jgi:RNA 2',3'-cyclic 3'-phosphodiesterase
MRLFVACVIPESIKERLTEVAAGCRLIHGLKWVGAANMHVTLKFLGEVQEALVPQVSSALHTVAEDTAPFSVAIAGVGGFPGLQNPRVLWAGIKTGAMQLSGLAVRVDEALHRVGFSREARPFSPHITLARVLERERPYGIAEAMQVFGSRNFGCYEVPDFYLVKSELRREGPAYTHIDRFTLRSDGSV